MSVTINDVARQAGVSMKTVSRVINNEPSVKKETFDRVMAAVKALNYQPNHAARNLAGTRSYSIAFVYDNPNAYYVIDMQNGILSACRQQGYELLIHPCNHQSKTIIEELTNLVQHSRVAGLVLTPPFSEMPQVVKTLDALGIQFVRIISGTEKGKFAQTCVFIDDHAAAYQLTEHLIKLGHQQIGFLCGGEQHRSTAERREGYEAALRDHGVKIDKRLIVEGEYAFDYGVKGAKKLLGKKDRPTAIFASNDEMAAGALFAARLMGLSVPGDVSIVGFEDSPFSRQTWPQLTTAHQSNRLIAQQATALLIARIREQLHPNFKAPEIQRHFVPELIVRESSTVATT
ncbi:LacI family DNA-binding transcriptional regulator [Permianibacter aggregans]|uniref:LacI family transcriptional regulator n=1 Tax=Permianibacter aggregans TaxID=1510150 RepID=A0A4R6ULG4_9GAMM|nr:LacI family DNA-binding transcriptional regulator [Permianibacter aggregans]QGX40228.1 LacI family DNA-binding transcriptional regulator [Permianibacter aggregans]TDQ47482.1 LacI family transcriptional regulator [Permianibacter aggregans]